jgi:hypothetical protein
MGMTCWYNNNHDGAISQEEFCDLFVEDFYDDALSSKTKQEIMNIYAGGVKDN